MLDALANWLTAHPLDYLQVFLVVGGIMCVHAVLKASRSSQTRLNVLDMLMGDDHKMSLTKTAQLGAFMISTWGFVHLVIYNQLTEWYYTSYMIAWAGTQVLTYYISRSRVVVNTPDQQVSVQSPPSATVNVNTSPQPPSEGS